MIYVKKNKEFLIIILSILILIILFYLVKFYFLNSTPQFEQDKQLFDNSNLNTNKLENCKFINNPSKQKICEIKLTTCFNDSCLYNKALVNNLETDCFKINNKTLKIQCTSNLKYNNLIQSVVIKQNISLCDNFKNKRNILKCKDNFYYVNSVNKADKSLCLNIKNEVFKNECKN